MSEKPGAGSSLSLRMRTLLPAAPEPPLPVSAFHFQGQTAYLLGGRRRGTGRPGYRRRWPLISVTSHGSSVKEPPFRYGVGWLTDGPSLELGIYFAFRLAFIHKGNQSMKQHFQCPLKSIYDTYVGGVGSLSFTHAEPYCTLRREAKLLFF